MRNEKQFLRNLKRDIKRTGNRKRRRFLKNIDASPEDFDLGCDRTDVMNERPREKPKRWDRNNTEIEACSTRPRRVARSARHPVTVEIVGSNPIGDA